MHTPIVCIVLWKHASFEECTFKLETKWCQAKRVYIE